MAPSKATKSRSSANGSANASLAAGQIAERTGLATASVTELIDRLEEKGFVRRTRDPDDRRRVLVEADPDRVSRMKPLFDSTRRSLEKLYARYSDAELATILDFMTENAKRLANETAILGDSSEQPKRRR